MSRGSWPSQGLYVKDHRKLPYWKDRAPEYMPCQAAFGMFDQPFPTMLPLISPVCPGSNLLFLIFQEDGRTLDKKRNTDGLAFLCILRIQLKIHITQDAWLSGMLHFTGYLLWIGCEGGGWIAAHGRLWRDFQVVVFSAIFSGGFQTKISNCGTLEVLWCRKRVLQF